MTRDIKSAKINRLSAKRRRENLENCIARKQYCSPFKIMTTERPFSQPTVLRSLAEPQRVRLRFTPCRPEKIQARFCHALNGGQYESNRATKVVQTDEKYSRPETAGKRWARRRARVNVQFLRKRIILTKEKTRRVLSDLGENLI